MAYEFNQAPKGLDEQRAAFKKAYPTLESLSTGRSYVMQPNTTGASPSWWLTLRTRAS